MRCPRLLRRLVAPLAAPIGDRRGATAIEYGLIAALMMLGIVVAIGSFSRDLWSLWDNVSVTVENAR